MGNLSFNHTQEQQSCPNQQSLNSDVSGSVLRKKKLNLKSALILGLILGFLISIKYTGAIFGLLMLPIFLFSLKY